VRLLIRGLLVLAAMVLPLRAAAQVDDIVTGYLRGGEAGRKPSVLLPAIISSSTITTMALLDHEPPTNNRVVRIAVVQAVTGASVSYIVARLLRPSPSEERYTELATANPAFREGFKRGYNEKLGGRQTISNVVGVLVGSLVSGAIYKMRTK
jgi:hypothetical protein